MTRRELPLCGTSATSWLSTSDSVQIAQIETVVLLDLSQYVPVLMLCAVYMTDHDITWYPQEHSSRLAGDLEQLYSFEYSIAVRKPYE